MIANRAAIVEPDADSDTSEATERTLRQRIHQQEILAELGVFALHSPSFMDLLDRTALLTAQGLEVKFCKVLEHLPAENRLLVRAGVGWNEGTIGVASIGADLDSPGGFALRTGKPVISNHLENEQRFRTPQLLVDHGIRRAMNVILQGDGAPFGVLEVDSRSDGEFGEQDIAFLQGAANVLGMAIERERRERRLKAALDAQQVLIGEINHRAKNSLQLIAGMLHLQAKVAGDKKLSQHLQEAASRVSAVGRLYQRLSHEADIKTIDLGAYLREVCKDLAEAAPHCALEIDAPPSILFSTERAIHLALILNELVTNACKYAYPDGTGPVRVGLRTDADRVIVTVSDDGVGLPAGFDVAKSKGLGMRIVTSLSEQLGATLTADTQAKGAHYTLSVPKDQ